MVEKASERLSDYTSHYCLYVLPDGVTREGLSQFVDKCFHVVVLAMAEQSAAFHTSVVHEISNLDEELSSDLWTEDLDYVIRRSVSEVKILQLKTEKSILCDLQVASNKEQLLTQLSQFEIEIETEKPTTWGEDVQMETNTVRWQRFWEIAYREAEALKIQSFVEISDGEDGEDGEDEEDESPLDRGDRGAMEREEGSSYVGEIRGGTVTEEEGAELDEVEVEVEEDEMEFVETGSLDAMPGSASSTASPEALPEFHNCISSSGGATNKLTSLSEGSQEGGRKALLTRSPSFSSIRNSFSQMTNAFITVMGSGDKHTLNKDHTLQVPLQEAAIIDNSPSSKDGSASMNKVHSSSPSCLPETLM